MWLTPGKLLRPIEDPYWRGYCDALDDLEHALSLNLEVNLWAHETREKFGLPEQENANE